MDSQTYAVTSDALGGLPEVEVTADSFEDAAEAAMELWEAGGTFAGETLHGPYKLLVINKDTLKSASVVVEVDYEVTYTAYEAEEHDE